MPRSYSQSSFKSPPNGWATVLLAVLLAPSLHAAEAATPYGAGDVVCDGSSAAAERLRFFATADWGAVASHRERMVDVVWADNTESHAEVTTFVLDLGSVGGAAGLTATVTSGRFAGSDLRIVNLRDPKALLRCVLNGLSQATGTTSLTFTQPL